MKRNEKIEVRVSLKEKERLSELAAQEGESKSGLIRGLVSKYVALNSPSTVRRLPKWQLAGMILIAALIGHGLTLIPMKLHQPSSELAETEPAAYYVHGVLEGGVFGVPLTAEKAEREMILSFDEERSVLLRLSFIPNPDQTGRLNISLCDIVEPSDCDPVYRKDIMLDRVGPSVIGDQLKTGEPIHIFVQELAGTPHRRSWAGTS